MQQCSNNKKIVYMQQKLGSRRPATAGPHVVLMDLRLGMAACECDDEAWARPTAAA